MITKPYHVCTRRASSARSCPSEQPSEEAPPVRLLMRSDSWHASDSSASGCSRLRQAALQGKGRWAGQLSEWL